MNVLFMTQSGSLELFFDVAQALFNSVRLEKVGFYISDSQFFESFKRKHPDFNKESYALLKEWDIISKSKDITPNIARLREYERLYGDPCLWNALVADRRIYLGSRATMQQDYASRFDHDRMLAILQVSIEELEAFFDSVRPDLIVGFICVTIGDYLAYLIARSRNLKFVNLRPTRIKNYFYAGESVLEPSSKLEATYHQMIANGISKELENEVRTFLEEVRQTHAMYEGVVPADLESIANGGEQKKNSASYSRVMSKIGSMIKQYYDYRWGEYRYDNSHKGVFFPRWFLKIKQPLYIRIVEMLLQRRYLSVRDLADIDYAFYPLHKEPEVTLLVYSRPYLNQIEVVRNIARSLPIGMKLLVKEHPACLGYRSLTYYLKLLAIPNVCLLPPQTRSRDIIQHAQLVAVISGSIGLEALIMKKPVIHLGHLPFSFLPNGMIRYVSSLDTLPDVIRDLLTTHSHSEDALGAYIAAVIQLSVPVDFYSILLGRKGVYRPGENNTGSNRQLQIENLSDYIVHRRFERNQAYI